MCRPRRLEWRVWEHFDRNIIGRRRCLPRLGGVILIIDQLVCLRLWVHRS